MEPASDGEWGGVPGRSEVKFRKGLAIVNIWRLGFGLILPRNPITTELNYRPCYEGHRDWEFVSLEYGSVAWVLDRDVVYTHAKRST